MDFTAWLKQGNKKEEEQRRLDQEMEEALAEMKASNKKVTPFEFIESIQVKKYLIDDKNASHYNPHIVTMGISQFVQNIGYAYEASKLQSLVSGLHTELANKLHYDYLFHTIREGKQYGKWAKVEKYEHLDLIMKTYSVNRDEGINILNRLTQDEVQQIVEWEETKKGGIKRGRSK